MFVRGVGVCASLMARVRRRSKRFSQPMKSWVLSPSSSLPKLGDREPALSSQAALGSRCDRLRDSWLLILWFPGHAANGQDNQTDFGLQVPWLQHKDEASALSEHVSDCLAQRATPSGVVHRAKESLPSGVRARAGPVAFSAKAFRFSCLLHVVGWTFFGQGLCRLQQAAFLLLPIFCCWPRWFCRGQPAGLLLWAARGMR